MAPVIDIERLTKLHPGGRGVRDLTLRVEEGEVFGFIGPNGAGKSTTIRALLGLLRPTSGRASILGFDAWRDGARARAGVGYLPGEPQLPEGLTVGEVLEDCGAFFARDTRARRAELCSLFDLDPSRHTEDLSLGNKKKVAIVAALQHQPRVYILDEPTNGLDPLVQSRFLEVLNEERARGATVFFSSHVLSEVERICDRVAVLREGRLVDVSRIEDLPARGVRKVRAKLPSPSAPCSAAELGGVSHVERHEARVKFVYTGRAVELMRALASDGVIDVVVEEPSLEEIVLAQYRSAA